MNEYQTGAVRDTGGKGRMDLLPMCALIRVSRHMEDAILPDPETGISHYPERNWEMGIPMHSMIDSAMRHLAKYVDGKTDEDHLCAAATNLLMAMWTEEKRPEMQDIPTRKKNFDKKLVSHASCVERKICSCYHEEGCYGPECWGTKERDSCDCNGDKSKCTHYPENKDEQ